MHDRRKIDGSISLFCWLLAICLISCGDGMDQDTPDNRPNMLLLVADDLGYADLGCYGGDIETPHIDQLAAEGIRFSRFHTSPLCAPTRAMLLSGNDSHIAGMGIQSSENSGFGYEGRLSERIVTIPALLRSHGYHTYMAGKWHLGRDSLSIPHSKGFERSFVNIRGAGNHYDDQGLFADDPITPYVEDGQPASWPKGAYSTDFYTDKLIEYIDQNREDQKPFFAFAAYTAPHWPLQVDEKYWRKYEGRYDGGYEKLREERLASLKAAGMIPNEAILPPLHENVRPWNSLSVHERERESRKMELYAGMVDNLDANIGRLLQFLKELGEFENTLIVFMSDNGAAPEDFFYNDTFAPFLRQHFSDDYAIMGQPNSFISYGPQWAEAGSSPFRYYKGLTTEGGIIAPLIISGPNVNRRGEIQDVFTTLLDIAPTFYEVAKTPYPEHWAGNEIYPLRGKSLSSFLSGTHQTIHSPNYVFGLEHDNLAMIRKGDWKIINIQRPFSEENFELYHVTQDLAEQNDLKAVEPQKFAELLNEWRAFAEEVKVKIPAPPW